MEFSAGARALAAVEFALRKEYIAEQHDFDAAPEPAPHFRSGIERFDQWHLCPGPYGVTTIVAASKIGKTTIAVSTALETAATRDWRGSTLRAVDACWPWTAIWSGRPPGCTMPTK